MVDLIISGPEILSTVFICCVCVLCWNAEKCTSKYVKEKVESYLCLMNFHHLVDFIRLALYLYTRNVVSVKKWRCFSFALVILVNVVYALFFLNFFFIQCVIQIK